MQVKDIMSTSVKTVTPATPLIEVVSLMCLYRYSGLIRLLKVDDLMTKRCHQCLTRHAHPEGRFPDGQQTLPTHPGGRW